MSTTPPRVLSSSSPVPSPLGQTMTSSDIWKVPSSSTPARLAKRWKATRQRRSTGGKAPRRCGPQSRCIKTEFGPVEVELDWGFERQNGRDEMIVAGAFKISCLPAEKVQEVLEVCQHTSSDSNELVFCPLLVGEFQEIWRRVKECIEKK